MQLHILGNRYMSATGTFMVYSIFKTLWLKYILEGLLTLLIVHHIYAKANMMLTIAAIENKEHHHDSNE